MKNPNIIFCNLQNSGSSAIDPVLRELLASLSYRIVPFGPDETKRLKEYFDHKEPLYHWTHDPIRTFRELGVLERLDYRYVYLHRDLRDVAVSFTKDYLFRGIFTDISLNKAIIKVVEEHLPGLVEAARDWLEFARRRPDLCMEIRFDEIKCDMATLIERILDFLGLSIDADFLRQLVDKHSFENVTGRKRGEEGDTVRTKYFYRKGISGEWRKHFGLITKEKFDEHFSKFLVDYGWEKRYDWGPKGRQLVSSPFSSGVSWLVNILLELNIKTTHLTEAQDHWRRRDQFFEITEEAFDLCRWHLPVLGRTREFAFKEDIEILWEHRLDFAAHVERPTLLFVRDPRDSICSTYHRHYEAAMPLNEYLSRPDIWPDHFPGMFGLPPADTWGYFHLFWMFMKAFIPLKIIQFEKMREAPFETIKEVLTFLSISRPDEAVLQALENSTFEKAKAHSRRIAQDAGYDRHVVRKGKVGEWRTLYTARELEAFNGPARYAMTLMGYDEAADNESEFEPVSYAEILAAYPSVLFSLKRAEDEIVRMNWENATQILTFAFLVPAINQNQQIFIATAILSADWTSRIFNNNKPIGTVAYAVFKRFVELNYFFREHHSVRALLGKIVTEKSEQSERKLRDNLGLIKNLLAVNNFDEVFRYAQDLSKFAPDLPYGFISAGTLLFRVSRYKESIPYLTRAVELSSGDSSLRKMLDAAKANADFKNNSGNTDRDD